MTIDRTKLEGARVYLRIRLRAEAKSRPDLLPLITEALALVESALKPPSAPTAPSPPRAERRRFAPTTPMQLPHYESTTWGRPGFAPTLAATQLAPLP